MANKITAILSINPNAQVTMTDGVIEWLDGTQEISETDIQAKKVELDNAENNEKQAKEDLKASAKAKLIAGEKLTKEEADTIVI